MLRLTPTCYLVLASLFGCGSTGDLVDPLRELPQIQRVSFLEDRPTLRVLPCAVDAEVLELFSRASQEDEGQGICRAAVERALSEASAFRVREDSDALYDLRVEEITLEGGAVATARIRAILWDTSTDMAVEPAIEVSGSERATKHLRPASLLGLDGLFDDSAQTHEVNAVQKALWKLAAKAQDLLQQSQ